MKILTTIGFSFFLLTIVYIFFIIANGFLVSGYLFFGLFFIALIFLLIFYLLKGKTFKKNKSDFISVGIILLFLIIYSISYTSFSYTKYTGTFLDEKIALINESDYKLSELEEYKTCLKEGCDIKKLYSDDILKINKLLVGDIEEIYPNKVDIINKMLEKKKLLIKNGYIIDDKIIFDEKLFLKNSLKKEYIRPKLFLDKMYFNIFINKKDFDEYRKSVYYFGYENIINSNIDSNFFYNSEFSLRSNYNFMYLLINREYFYKGVFATIQEVENIYNAYEIIKSYVEKINGKL